MGKVPFIALFLMSSFFFKIDAGSTKWIFFPNIFHHTGFQTFPSEHGNISKEYIKPPPLPLPLFFPDFLPRRSYFGSDPVRYIPEELQNLNDMKTADSTLAKGSEIPMVSADIASVSPKLEDSSKDILYKKSDNTILKETEKALEVPSENANMPKVYNKEPPFIFRFLFPHLFPPSYFGSDSGRDRHMPKEMTQINHIKTPDYSLTADSEIPIVTENRLNETMYTKTDNSILNQAEKTVVILELQLNNSILTKLNVRGNFKGNATDQIPPTTAVPLYHVKVKNTERNPLFSKNFSDSFFNPYRFVRAMYSQRHTIYKSGKEDKQQISGIANLGNVTVNETGDTMLNSTMMKEKGNCSHFRVMARYLLLWRINWVSVFVDFLFIMMLACGLIAGIYMCRCCLDSSKYTHEGTTIKLMQKPVSIV